MTTATLEQLHQDFSQQLLNFITKRVNNADDARDILQDVYVKIINNIETLSNHERLQPWLYRVAQNAIIDYYRRRARAAEMQEKYLNDFDEDSFEAENETPALLGLEGCLKRFIEKLPAHYRQAIVASELEGKKQSEIAHMLKAPASTVRSHVQRGRKQLKTLLTQCCRVEFDSAGGVTSYAPHPENCSPDNPDGCGGGCN